MRFSDEELVRFKDEFEQHLLDESEWRKAQTERWDCLMEATERNTEATRQNQEALAQLIQDSRDVIQLHRDLQGAARIGVGVQKFAIWMLKLGAVGSMLAGALLYVAEHWPKE